MIKNWFIVVCQEWFETLLVPNSYHRSLSVPAECSTTILFIKRSNMARWPKKTPKSDSLCSLLHAFWTLRWGGPGQDVMSNAKLSALPWLAVLVIQASCLYATLWPRQQNNSAMGRIWLQVANKTTCQSIWHPKNVWLAPLAPLFASSISAAYSCSKNHASLEEGMPPRWSCPFLEGYSPDPADGTWYRIWMCYCCFVSLNLCIYIYMVTIYIYDMLYIKPLEISFTFQHTLGTITIIYCFTHTAKNAWTAGQT